ncbi:MAG: hypothetical protein IJ438_11995 [Clostridia bacterium]|nr:hypothetical protein [Clostridia bacterium]
MSHSTVFVSLRDENGLDCSYARVHKGDSSVLIVLRGTECGVFDNSLAHWHYLLLKHYPCDAHALRDFYKLIGKMCAKSPQSKYFGPHKDEDNRMVVTTGGSEHMLQPEERSTYEARYQAFKVFVTAQRERF